MLARVRICCHRASVAMVVRLAACGPSVEPEGPAASTETSAAEISSADTTSSSSSSTSASSSTSDTSSSGASTGPVDPETYCAQFIEPRACLGNEREVYCDWVEATPVTLAEGSCTLADPIGECLAINGNTTVGGCFPPEGCPSEPFFTEVDGQVRVIVQCGGSLPFGYEPCTYVEPGVFEPPECGCICDEPVETDDDGGSST